MVPVPTMTPTHRSPRHPRRPSRPPPNRANRARRRASILGGDRHAKAVERVTELDLARKPRLGITVGGGIEQIILVLAHRRQFGRKFRVDMDVAGGARTATAAQGKHFVDAVVADHFHHRKARLARDHAFFPFAGDDDKCGHAILLAVSPPPCRPRAARSRDRPMGLTADQLRAGIDALAAGEPGFAAALARAGYPEPRLRDRGYATLLRRSEEHTSELQSLMRTSYAVFCLKK